METSNAQRRRGRRARSSTSQENLIKDSSSDVSPRELSAPVVTDRRRQRRAQRLPTGQDYDNQAFDADDRPPAHPIGRVNEDDEEEENVQHAERLAKHVTKQHRRVVNEVQQQSKQPRKPATSDDTVGDDQEALTEQIKEHQKILSKRVDGADSGHTLPVEPLPSTIGTGPDRSIENILEKAKRARSTQPMGEEYMSTMNSSRRFGATSEMKLQRTLGKRDTNIDPTLLSTSTTRGDMSTRFDLDNIHDKRMRQEIEKKQKDRISRWTEVSDGVNIVPSIHEKDDFFLKVWTEEADESAPHAESTTVAPVTTADNIVGEQSKPIDEDEQDDDQASTHDKISSDERQPLLRMFGDAQPAQYQRAERELNDSEQLDFEEKHYKYVIGQPIGLHEKFGDGAIQPRSLEDEGIFVGKKPVVPARVIRRVEKRVYEECIQDNKPPERLFGPDGALIALPDPTKFVPTRPLIDDLFDPALGKEFCKAYQVDNEHGVSSDPIGADRYRLDIDLGKITFIHHHYMSIEHVLAMRLKQMYEHYTVRRQQRIVQQLSEKIKALKSAEHNCRTLYEQHKYSETNVPDELKERLNNYRNELRQARKERCSEMRLDRELFKNLLNTWQKIKETRLTNNYSTTSVKLIIKQISSKKAKQYEQMQQQIEEEIADEIALAEEQYQHEKAVHAQIARSRKLQDTRKKAARKRLDKKRAAAMNTDNIDGEYEQNDVTIINEEEIYVPEKPEARNPDDIRTAILTNYQNSLQTQDEPEILLELVFSEPISTDAECSARERARRYHLQTSTAIIARILINGKVMTDTPAVPLTSEFEANFGQIYPSYVVRTPETIKIEFYESSTRFRSPLAELYLPVPESTVTNDNYQLQKYEFSSNVLREFNASQTTAVGAGIPSPLNIGDGIINYLSIEGILNAGIAWGVQDGVPLVPPDYTTSKAYLSRQMGGGIQQDINMQGINLNNMKNLIEWIKQSNLDPYDPDNAFLINIMKDYMISRADTNLEINSLQHFRLSIDQADEMDPDQEYMNIDNSLRFKLLQARNENLPDFKDFKCVPPYDYLVRRKYGVFKRFMTRQQEAADGDGSESLFQGKRQTRIDIVRRQGERQLRKMREQLLARFAIVSTRKSFQEIVVEESIPNIQALRGLIANLYIAPARPLYPNRRLTEQKKVANIALAANQEVYILVNLIGAMDLPIRNTALLRDGDKSGNAAKRNAERTALVRPYVEIQFQKRTYRTSIADGPNPSWNEELRVTFRPQDNDFEASSLQRCRDILYINVFDQVDLDLPQIDGQRDQIILKRIARNWLGSIKIPFSNIYINQRLEGNYRLSVPSSLIGYTKGRLSQKKTDGPQIIQPASVLRMFVTMEPLLATPEIISQSYDSTESLELLERAHSWVTDLKKRFPDREYTATVSDINGRAVFIPRFLRPLPCPPLDPTTASTVGTNNQVLCQRLARFVSLIPFITDAINFPGICDIWETSDQFLNTMSGDDEEHAVLLNNYFLSLNKKTWIALGTSIYSGVTWFVLTKDDEQRYPICWSVSDGRDASTIETWNPIRHLYLLVNEENIWANIQQQDLPSRMNFDINNSSQWRPFFDRSFPRNALSWTSVQPSDLRYEQTRNEDVAELEQNIFTVLRDKLVNWRHPYATFWDSACQRRLNEILRTKEESYIIGSTHNTADIDQELKEFQNLNNMTGFSLQMPYTNMQVIVDTVYSTKVFEHATNDIRFALSVHVNAYPNNVLAVWIYIANSLKKTG